MLTTEVTVAVLFLCFLTLGRAEFQTEKVDGNSGLYFEDAGNILFYNHEWQIVSNVNLTSYRMELNHFQHLVRVIKDHCDRLNEMEKKTLISVSNIKVSERPTVYQLGMLMAEIEENDRNWFGTDAGVKHNIASDLVEEFRNMSASGTKTSTSFDRRATYISLTMNSAVTYDANFTSVVENTLALAAKDWIGNVQFFQLRNTVKDYISKQMLLLTTFKSKQKQYSSILSLVGKKNAQIPILLSPDTLLIELNQIRNIVGEEGLDFPLKLTSNNFQILFHFSSPEISSFDDQIFVTCRVPLISKFPSNRFTLFKVTSSLYNVKGNLYSFVVPTTNYVAIDNNSEHYTSLTIDDLSKCHQIGNSTICKQTSMMSTSTSSECEISVLHKRLFQDIHCNSRLIRTNAEIFVKVLKPNSWLVAMPKTTKVRYICEGRHTQELFIQLNGLLTIDANCKFATDNVVLTGHSVFANSSIHEHSTGNFSEKFEMQLKLADDLIVVIDDSMSINSPQIINYNENEKLLRLSYSMKDLQSKLDRLDKRRNDKVFLAFLIPAVLILVCLGVGPVLHERKIRLFPRNVEN